MAEEIQKDNTGKVESEKQKQEHETPGENAEKGKGKKDEGKVVTAKPPSPVEQLSDLTTLEHSLATLRQLLVNNRKEVLEQNEEVG